MGDLIGLEMKTYFTAGKEAATWYPCHPNNKTVTMFMTHSFHK
jgi:hypothetical protein